MNRYNVHCKSKKLNWKGESIYVYLSIWSWSKVEIPFENVWCFYFLRLALHAAVLAGHVSTLKLLLEYGAQVDAMDVMKHTPLFRACEMGHKEVIQTLIEG